MTAHEIDYQIYGEEMQYVEIELDPQEAVVAEAGSFMMMDSGIQMETIFGDGSNQDKGVLGKLFSAGKRLLTGESLFMTAFLNTVQGKKKVSFASPYPGKIIPIDLTEFRGKFICQKDAFLCAAKGVSVGIEFSRKLGRGLFGGEGFIMQKLEGDGMAFVHAGGTLGRKELAAGEELKVDTGCIVGFTQTVDYDIEFVGGIKNTIFGGEGLFFARLRGPGTVYVQSLPFSRLAGRVLAAAPRGGGKDKGEGSLLGGLGNLLDGDNRF
ncbi:TIGR00266 family protein [Flavobacteriaceae bacterium M23B6Z8]